MPLAEWLRNEIREQAFRLLFQSSTGLCDYFKMDQVKRLWDDHQDRTQDYADELWNMVMFQLWHDRYAARDVS